MPNQKLSEIYAEFLELYNSCAKGFAATVSDLFVEHEWTPEEGKEERMKALREIWCELLNIELSYTDDESYCHNLCGIRRRLLLL